MRTAFTVWLLLVALLAVALIVLAVLTAAVDDPAVALLVIAAVLCGGWEAFRRWRWSHRH